MFFLTFLNGFSSSQAYSLQAKLKTMLNVAKYLLTVAGVLVFLPFLGLGLGSFSSFSLHCVIISKIK